MIEVDIPGIPDGFTAKMDAKELIIYDDCGFISAEINRDWLNHVSKLFDEIEGNLSFQGLQDELE